MMVESGRLVKTPELVELRTRELTIEICYLLRSSSVSSRILEMIRHLAENNKSSFSISQVSDKHLVLRISGCCRKAKGSGNILIFHNEDDFTTINLCNGGDMVECMVSLHGWEKGCSSLFRYHGDIVNDNAVSAFKGLLGLARDLAPAKSKRRQYKRS